MLLPSREIQRLRTALEDLRRQQDENARRLSAIEKALGIDYTPPPADPAPPPAPAPASGRPALESRIGLAWINRIGVVTLILGAGFFFKLAVENRWIGEGARVAIGVLGGLAAIHFAHRLWRSGQVVFAQGLGAAGIAVEYLAFYSAGVLYGLVPEWLAFASMFAATAGAGMLALRYEAPALAALGLFGGFATPLLLGTAAAQSWFYLSYVLLLDLAAMALSRRRRWRLPALIALAGTAVLFAAWMGQPVREKWTATLYAGLYLAVFSSTPQALVFSAAHALAALALTATWPQGVLPFSPLLLTLAVVGLWLPAKRAWRFSPLIGVSAVWIAQAFWWGGSGARLSLLLLMETALFATVIAWALIRRGAFGPAELLAFPVNAAAYYALLYAQMQPAYSGFTGLAAVILAVIHMLLAAALSPVRTTAAMLAGVAWTFLVLAVPIQFSGYTVSMLWSVEAAAACWTAARFVERRAVWPSLVLFAMALVQLVVTPTDPSHAGRSLPFLTAGASLGAAAYWLRRMHPSAGPLYALGHAVALSGLLLEVTAWAMRNARPEEFASVSAAAVTILMAAYALWLAAFGVVRRSLFDRVLGLVLIGIVVAKLYFYDVWLLGRGYRVAAFSILGALLLAMSYLYSRYRASVEAWWRR